MLRTALAVVSAITLAGLMAYPTLYVTFPWTIPVAYLAALMAAMAGFVIAVCR